MSFYRKSVNASFLGFDDLSHPPPPQPPLTPSSYFNAASGDFSDEIGLTSCTESLGFESSDETMSSVDDLDAFVNFNRSNSCKSTSNDFDCCSDSCSSCSSISNFENSRMMTKNQNHKMMMNKKEFPPPLTSLSENGRRNFTLKSVRKDGRLEIFEVKIERPEILFASRENGRLTLHLVKSLPEFDDVEDGEETEEEEERENEEIEENREEITEERESEEGITEERENEEREWKMRSPVRRCYDHVWGKQQQQQQRCVTTI